MIASTSRNIALGSVRLRFSRMLIARRKVSHIRALRHKDAPSSLTAEDEPQEFAVEEKDESGHDPGSAFHPPRVHQRPHLCAIAGELNQRNNGEWQLKAKNPLAQNDQRGDFALSRKPDHG